MVNERNSSRPDVSVGADGTAAAVWEQTVAGTFTAVFGRVRTPEGSWGPVQRISGGDTKVLRPRVVVRDDGSVVAVWSIWSDQEFTNLIEASIQHPGGTFGSPRRLSGVDSNSYHQDIALDPAGRVHVVWAQSNGTRSVIKRMFIAPDDALRYPAADLWQKRGNASNPRIDIGPDGTGAVIWQLDNVKASYDQSILEVFEHGSFVRRRLIMVTQFDPSYAAGDKRSTILVSKVVMDDDSFGDVDLASEEVIEATDNEQPDVEVGADGTLLAVWKKVRGNEYIHLGGWSSRDDYRIGNHPDPTIQFRALNYDHSSDEWETSEIIDLHKDPTVRDPQVSADPKRSVTVIWAAGKGGSVQTGDGGRVRSAMRPGISSLVSADEYWSVDSWVFRDLSDRSDRVFTAPDIEVGGDGTTTVVWARGEDGQAIESRTRQADSAVFGPTVRLSSPVDFGSVPRVSVGEDGNAMAVWNQMPPGGAHVVHTAFTAGSQPLELSVLGGGSLESDLPGASCGSECRSTLPYDREVTLTARPDSGSVLAAWGGACASVTGPVCKVRMDRARNVSVEFGPAEELVVSRSGPGVVRGASGFSRIDCGSVCSGDVLRGKSIVLEAVPDSGFTFAGWTGDCEGLGRFCSVSMSEARDVEARFARFFNLRVNRFGDGSVISEPAGIDCSLSVGSCVRAFESGTVVTLTVSPGEGSAFAGWSGACSGAGEACVVTVDRSLTVAASFNDSTPLTVQIQSPGLGSVNASSGALDCSATRCQGSFALGSEVTLSPVSGAGAAFTGWSGCPEVVDGRCVVSMDSPVEVTANFVPGESFTVGFEGGGSGRVVSDPVGVDCHGSAGESCENGFVSGTEVTLTAHPDPGSVFVGWVKGDPSDFTGGCEGTGASCVSTVGLPVRVTAVFEAEPEPEPEPEPEGPVLVPGEGCVLPSLQVSQLKRSSRGAAVLRVKAPRAGVAVIRGAQVRKTRVKLTRAGWSRVKVKPTRKLSNRLKRHRSVRTRVTVRYLTNDGCQPALTRARVTFKG